MLFLNFCYLFTFYCTCFGGFSGFVLLFRVLVHAGADQGRVNSMIQYYQEFRSLNVCDLKYNLKQAHFYW